MKSYSATAMRFILFLATACVCNGPAFCARSEAQPLLPGMVDPKTGLIAPNRSLKPGSIDPTTGLMVPGPASPGGGIDPATGLPIAGAGRPLPGRAGAIDPLTGLPIPAALPAGVTPAAAAEDSAQGNLSRARQRMNQGRFEDALQCYLAYQAQVRLSPTNGVLALALPDWVELGQRYPKAKRALLSLRDDDTNEFVQGRGTPELFSELAAINSALGDKEATFALFLGLEQADTPLARECYLYLEPALVERAEYEVCARYLGNPQGRFDIARHLLALNEDLAQRQQRVVQRPAELPNAPGAPRPALPVTDTATLLRKASTDNFVGTVNRLLQILVGAGRPAEAEKLRAQALDTLDEPGRWPTLAELEAKTKAAQAAAAPRPTPLIIHAQLVEGTALFPKLLPPSASLEQWAPELAPDARPDVQKILAEAKTLAANHQYEPALQRHLWYHRHALEYEPEAQRGVRLSFALADWVALGRDYPKAREALVEVRDWDLHEFAEGRGSTALFKDIAAINGQWGHERTTAQLFGYLKDHQPELAQRCYPLAEDALVKQGDYALCLAYLGDGQARFSQHRQNWERLAQWEHRLEQTRLQAQPQAEEPAARSGHTLPAGGPRFGPPAVADHLFIQSTRQLVEILVGGGHKDDAEKIRTQALALVAAPQLESAVSDAERKLGR